MFWSSTLLTVRVCHMTWTSYRMALPGVPIFMCSYHVRTAWNNRLPNKAAALPAGAALSGRQVLTIGDQLKGLLELRYRVNSGVSRSEFARQNFNGLVRKLQVVVPNFVTYFRREWEANLGAPFHRFAHLSTRDTEARVLQRLVTVQRRVTLLVCSTAPPVRLWSCVQSRGCCCSATR